VGLVLTLFAARSACNNESFNRAQVFEKLAESETYRVADVFLDLQDLQDTQLAGLARFYECCDVVTADEFTRFTIPLSDNPAAKSSSNPNPETVLHSGFTCYGRSPSLRTIRPKPFRGNDLAAKVRAALHKPSQPQAPASRHPRPASRKIRLGTRAFPLLTEPLEWQRRNTCKIV
jgi:CHASE1-domain containing sensor protein